ncbi:MAG: hypothetical protein ABI432_17910 [Flavobacteriales bacterium]
MRPARSTIVLLAVLLANAAVILFFRFFITVDGPMHVLHASLLEAPWTTHDHLAHGIIYDSEALRGWLGDRVLMVLLLFSTPEQAHDLFATLVSCTVVLSVFAFLRAHGTRPGLAILWLAPITFSFVLILGLFHFLLGVAVSFATVAWWKWHERAPRMRLTGLLIGGLIAWSTHRSAPILMCTIFLAAFLMEVAGRRTAATTRERRNPLLQVAIVGSLILVSALAMHRIVHGITLPLPRELPVFNEALLLRPLLLLDPVREQWLVRSIGILLVISLCAGIWARTRLGRKLRSQDVPLALFLFFLLIAWLGNTPHGRQLLIAERCQWLALVAMAMWLVAIADVHRGTASKLIGILALLALPLHVVRIVQAEASFFHLEPAHDLAIEAGDALAPGGLVFAVQAGPNALLQHLEAYVAVGHSGLLLTANEGLSFKGTSDRTAARLRRMARDPYWMIRHWRTGIPPEVDQILFIGSDIERTTSKHPWSNLLPERWRLSFDNGYSRIYTRRTARDS